MIRVRRDQREPERLPGRKFRAPDYNVNYVGYEFVCDDCRKAVLVSADSRDLLLAAVPAAANHQKWDVRGEYGLCPECQDWSEWM